MGKIRPPTNTYLEVRAAPLMRYLLEMQTYFSRSRVLSCMKPQIKKVFFIRRLKIRKNLKHFAFHLLDNKKIQYRSSHNESLF